MKKVINPSEYFSNTVTKLTAMQKELDLMKEEGVVLFEEEMDFPSILQVGYSKKTEDFECKIIFLRIHFSPRTPLGVSGPLYDIHFRFGIDFKGKEKEAQKSEGYISLIQSEESKLNLVAHSATIQFNDDEKIIDCGGSSKLAIKEKTDFDAIKQRAIYFFEQLGIKKNFGYIKRDFSIGTAA